MIRGDITVLKKILAVGAPAALFVTFAFPATAQEDTSAIVFEEVVVTATKREQTLQEIPVAVSVVSGADIQESQVLDVKDLQFLVPSLKITQLQTAGNTNFIIRGFGNGANNAGIEPSVGVFIDGVYRSRSAAALNDLPNVERIEVLRGPQNTLFGKNASAGVISVVTAKPDLNETTGSASLTVGDYNQVIVKADVNGPLSDTAGFSLSGSYNERDGYYDNLVDGKALGNQDRFGVRGQLYFEPSNEFNLRLIADYSELDELCCGAANLSTGPTTPAILGAGGNLVPEEPFAYEGYFDASPVNEFESSGISAQFEWDINDAVTLTSITAFRTLGRFENGDIDFTSAALTEPEAGNLTDVDIDTITQEFRIAGATDRTAWMLGAYIFDEDIEQTTALLYGPGFRAYADLLTGGTPGVPGTSPLWTFEALYGLAPGTFQGTGQGLTEVSTMDNQAFSIFGTVDFALGDRATLTLGANYTEDEKDVTFDSTGTDVFSNTDLNNDLTVLGVPLPTVLFGEAFTDATGLDPTPANIALIEMLMPGTTAAINAGVASAIGDLQGLQFLPPNISYPNAVESGRSDDDNLSWTVRLAFDWTDDVNVYLGASTGFKASSWNLSRDSRPFARDLTALGAAGLLVPNISTGTRFASPEESTVYEIGLKGQWDTVAINVALFEQELEDFQSNIFRGTGFVLDNAEKRSTTGAEFDIRWAPTEAFEGTLSATILDSKYDEFLGAEGPDNTAVDLINADVPGVPELSVTATGRYGFTVGEAAGYVRLEYVYEDEVQVIENVPENLASREISTLNMSLGLSWDNGFEAMLWGRNITNDEYLLSAFPSPAQNNPPGAYSGYPNQPRTYGVTVRKYFD